MTFHNHIKVSRPDIRGENADADAVAVINNIRIHIQIMRLSLLGIHIRTVITFIECSYYLLSAYAVFGHFGLLSKFICILK
jgi:hypothetical protein